MMMKYLTKKNSKVLFAAWGCHNKKWHTYQLFDNLLRTLFKEVITFDPQEVLYKKGKEYMNKSFLEIVEKEKPDYMFLWLMHDEFLMETLVKARELSPKTISFCYNGDDDYKFENYTINLFPVIDYFLTTQPPYLDKYKEYGKIPFFACGANITEFKPLNLKKKYDVSFVGTPKNDRVENMRHLLKNGINFVVCGAGWEKYPEFKKFHLGEIDHHQFIKLINESKINICLSKNYFGGTHILERFFEINACKSFCLTEHADSYFPLFKEGKDIASFKNKEELLKKVNYYLSHENERENIAKNAYLKTIKGFSNIALIKKAIDYMDSNPTPHKNLLETINKKYIYLGKEDFKKGKDYIKSIVNDYDYIFFKTNDYSSLKHREYFQMHSLELTGKPISCCDSYHYSRLIGDYSWLALHYLYDLKDKSFFYNNLNIGKLAVKKEYFIKNIDLFRDLFKGKFKEKINKENTLFLSIPLVRTNKNLSSIPYGNIEHIFFSNFEGELLALRNQGKLLRTMFLPKLLIYSIIINPAIGKYLILNTSKRSKNKFLIKISNFLEKLL
jgi:spore maturation protein CgeB